MTIVFAVLKWLGILLAGILGLAVVLVLLALFVPVRYKLHMVKQERFCYGFRISYLFPVLFVRKRMEDDCVMLCVFGIPVHRFSQAEADAAGKEAAEAERKEETEPDHRAGEHVPEQRTEAVLETLEQKAEKKQSVSGKKTEKNQSVSGKKPENAQKARKEKAGKLRRKSGHRKKKEKQVSGTKKKKGGIRFLFQKISGIIKFIRREDTRKVIRLLKKELWALILYIFPGKIRGEVHVGTGDPAYTGILIGGISLIPAVYRKGFRVIPDFDDAVMEADVTMAGRMRVIYFIRLFMRLYREENIRRIWDRFRK